jgi:hypothetical protein
VENTTAFINAAFNGAREEMSLMSGDKIDLAGRLGTKYEQKLAICI